MQVSAVAAAASPLRSRMRWAILALLFLSTVINYVDRQTLSILASTIQADLGMSDLDYAAVVQLFLVAYTIAHLGAGWLTDRLGPKLGLALFVCWWSTANLVTGFAQSAMQLGAARFALGLGEAGNYTAAPKTVAERFPAHERGFAVGVYTAGAMVGATIAPPLIGWLALAHGWRAAFFATGALGFVWVVGWWLVHHWSPPVQAPRAAEAGGRWGWIPLLRQRPVWGLALARMITDPVWYFYLFWFPKYMIDDRGLTLMQMAQVAWVVYLAADLGSIGGGVASGRLVRRGMAPARSRLWLMGIAALLAPIGATIAGEPSIATTFALAALVACAHLVFLTNITTLAVDTFPSRHVATIFGIIAAGSGLGGMLSTRVVGEFANEQSYGPLFLMMALLHPLGWLVAWWAVRKPAAAQAPG
ncbi:MFS transporter [Luteimonas salinilitoris]|uniref:MFS transporter n=1 Tax=Luteimonas salinilitoris TaxID=3237697 RepID=A0ABV4HMF7_9GAMM